MKWLGIAGVDGSGAGHQPEPTLKGIAFFWGEAEKAFTGDFIENRIDLGHPECFEIRDFRLDHRVLVTAWRWTRYRQPALGLSPLLPEFG